MPVRVRAKPPGEFIRDHLTAVGGVDYPQAVLKAYKLYLKAQGLKDGVSHSTMSHYFYLANRLGLIEFDHAETTGRWGAIVDGVEVPEAYTREPRPLAPSPRHYYRILDPTDPRWVRLEASYRESIGIEVPPPFPRVPIKPPPPKVVKPPKVKPPVAKPPRPPRVVPPRPPTPREQVAPYEVRMAAISAKLDELERAPTLERVSEFEEELIVLGEDIVEAARKARGVERTLLGTINSRIRMALEEINLLRTSVERVLIARTAAERERQEAALRAAIRVVREDLAPAEEAGGEE